jgi:hypothetical protein
MDIEEGIGPIERAATMSIACENRVVFRAAKRYCENLQSVQVGINCTN